MRTWARTPNTGSVGSTLIHSRLGNGSTSDTPPQEEASEAAGTKILGIKCHSLLLNVLTFQSLWRQGSRTTAPSQCHPRIFMARMHASTHACHSTLPAYNACSVFYLLGNMYLKVHSLCLYHLNKQMGEDRAQQGWKNASCLWMKCSDKIFFTVLPCTMRTSILAHTVNKCYLVHPRL